MSDYQAPTRDMQFVLYEVLDAESQWAAIPQLADALNRETADAIIEEGAKLTAEVIAPLNRSGDEQGCVFDEGVVTSPDGFKEAFQLFSAGGWGGLCGDPEYGGMGMPKLLAAQFDEMMQAASISFMLYPMLNAGACLAVAAHASEALKQTYLENIYSGTWSATMCLTEPHAGSDLGIMRSKAEPCDDGSYRISGTKIFITGGEHDLTDNIIHLVLAKVPGGPAGSRGISLFLVPKILVNDDGSLGERNGVSCGSIEHKMGIKASATCVMNFDGATGYLVGELNRGLAGMFTMMNYERLGMGIQGLGASERSYQTAVAYARERKQGRSANSGESAADPIIQHPDVRRMLLNMRALNEAGRCFSGYVAMQLDIAKFEQDAEKRAAADELVALLTPVAKAFMTDRGFECCVDGQQVLGGHGYVREWGQEQLVRDVRIAQIYEGTNGIQALDLLGRKVVANGGAFFARFASEISRFIDNQAGVEPMIEFVEPLRVALGKLQQVTDELIETAAADKNAVNASAVDYMNLFGYVAYAWTWALMASKSVGREDDSFYAAKVEVARFYMQRLLPRIETHLLQIRAGSGSLMALADDLV